MSFYHDSTGVNPDQEYQLLPDGWYPFKITDAEEMHSKNGNDMILAKCRVFNDPRYPDAEVWHYVTFLPKGQKGAGVSVHFRKCIGVPFGGNDLVEADDWIGKKFMGKVETDEYNGKRRNKIIAVSPLKKDQAAAAPADPKDLAMKAQAPAEDEVPF